MKVTIDDVTMKIQLNAEDVAELIKPVVSGEHKTSSISTGGVVVEFIRKAEGRSRIWEVLNDS